MESPPVSPALVPVEQDVQHTPHTQTLLGKIRPQWQSKRLIERTRVLLEADPSSACQRLLNATIHDLREKIVTAGLDIAKEAAIRYRLPQVNNKDDIAENYSVSRIIELSYRMGLLSRPEWRKICRCYEIRRDLEHEDDEYEAEVQDILYIFKSCIDIVLSRDPIQPVRVKDVSDLIESQKEAAATPELLREFEQAPDIRQSEIVELLVNTALKSDKADIIRQNAFRLLNEISPIIKRETQINIASKIQERTNKNKRLDLIYAKVANAAGVIAYIKQSLVTDLFNWILNRLKCATTDWRAHDEHESPLSDLEDVGGLVCCPQSLHSGFLEWLVVCYIGTPGGYGEHGRNRKVFYSNVAAPIIKRIIKATKNKISIDWSNLENERKIQKAIADKHVARRFESLKDLTD